MTSSTKGHNRFLIPGILIIVVIFLVLIIPGLIQKDLPNVIFIIADTVRADHTNLGSGQTIMTPNLDKHLKPVAAYYGTSYANAPWTLPSIASTITSRYPSQLGVSKRNSHLAEEETTLAEYLKQEGYQTHGLVSHIFLKKKYGMAQGFDNYVERIASENHNLYSITSPQITQDAVKFIQENKNNRFFLFLHYFDPHYRYFDHEKKLTYNGPFLPERDEKTKAEIIRLGTYQKSDLEYLHYCYETEIRFTDRYIGDVLQALKTNRLFENSIIIFLSDHGEEFNERGALGHGQSLYQEQILVPFAIKLPINIKNKKVRRKLVSNIDLVPTLLDLLNVKIPKNLEGRSIFAPPGKNEMAFSEVNEKKYQTLYNQIALIKDNWKLVLDFDKKSYEFYNLDFDIREKENLYKKKEMKSFFDLVRILKKNIPKIRNQPKKGKKTTLTEKEKRDLESLGYR